MAKVKIVNADVIEWAKNYRGEKFHALFGDAPYELNFMGKNWDSSGIAFNPDTWAALSEHLLPGAFLFVFAGTLNDDLISVAMRQAGLRKFHKACLWWSYGSGFPKSSRIDTAIDRAAGAKRKIIGKSNRHNSRSFGNGNGNIDYGAYKGGIPDITAPATPLAKTWAGHRYGLQAIKPAAETILIFQKPYDGKPVDSIVKNGSGALNVDGARIPGNMWQSHFATGLAKNKFFTDGEAKEILKEPHNLGRWPANLILQHSDCNGTCSPSCPCRELDEQSGILKSGYRENRNNHKHNKGVYGGNSYLNSSTNYNKDQAAFDDGGGGASRFFFNATWNHEAAEQISNAAAVRYVAKASRRERDAGLEDFSLQHRDCCQQRKNNGSGKLLNGTGTVQPLHNPHPTLKPLSLTKYLATLLLPPAEYAPRRILVPFAGVASEAIGAMLAGWEEVTAIEKEKEYCEIGRARVKYWQNHKEPVAKKSKPQKVSEPHVAELFPEYE